MVEDKEIEIAGSIVSPAVGLIPAENVPLIWETVLGILQDKGERWLKVVDENAIYDLLVAGQADLWCGAHNGEIEVIAVCMREVHAKASYYHVCFLGGKSFKKYFKLGVQKIEQYAAITNATEVVFEGRKGFVRMLKPLGYFSNTIRMRKTVSVMWRN